MNGKRARKLRAKAFHQSGTMKGDRRINPDGKPNKAPVHPGEVYFQDDNDTTRLEPDSAKGLYRKLKKDYLEKKRAPRG